MGLIIEITCDHWATAKKAIQHGADRLELCSALALGGLTPTTAFVKHTCMEYDTPIMCLIRSRPGHFCYTDAEKNQMFTEMTDCIDAGAKGLVVGALTEENLIDWAFAEYVSEQFKDIELVFHRAFDFAKDSQTNILRLRDLGYSRILTSGHADTAWNGRDNLKSFIQLANNKITILPAAGINAQNALALAEYIHCKELHLSAKQIIPAAIENSIINLDYYDIDANEIQMLKSQFNSL